jgi:phosphate-selective porin OprO and OprP
MTIKTSLCAGAALGVVMLMGATSAQAQDTTVAWKGAPQWTNDDVQFKVRGRILLDYVYQDVERVGALADYKTSNARGRQVFLGVEGKLNNYFAYKIEGGAVNGGAWAWDDAVLEFKPADMSSIMVGNVKAAGLENMTSTRFISFMDRGPYGDIAVDSYLLSVVGKLNGQNWTVTGQVAGDSLNSADVDNTAAANPGSKERVGYTARATFAPINGDRDKLHLGAWARYRNHGDEAAFNYRGRTNTGYGNTRYYSTGAIGDTDQTLAFEGAYVRGPFSVQGEYAQIKIDRLKTVQPGGDPDINVGYAFVSFWPTGEMRNYDPTKGEFGRPKIVSPVTSGGLGGLELLARYDFADLTDVYSSASTAAGRTAAQDAGEYSAWTLGVNYYPTAYVRVQANYTDGEIDNPVAGRDVELKQFQLRAQLDF